MNQRTLISTSRKSIAPIAAGFLVVLSVLIGCVATSTHGSGNGKVAAVNATLADRTAHLDKVFRADFCAKCHPEATAEHRMNTHGRAFSDPEVRLATAKFSIPGCIDCHTPRPIFETGLGKNPVKRLHHLEEANDCMSCHAKGGFDFSTFEGGARECKDAFDERVGSVEACASCHRNHGTPYQWENAEYGKKAGNLCVDCHMPFVERPIATGMPAKKTRRHTFFGARSESQLKMAYDYHVQIEGSEVVAKITNAGVGHNFPTELKQRSVESLVIVRDTAGREVSRSRRVFRDPYKRPYGLKLEVNTQIPSGESREHRVPLSVAVGTVETQLLFKLYYPIEDGHPDLSRTLESRSMPFGPIEPSTRSVTTEPEIQASLPEAMIAEAASPGNLADFARPKIDKVAVDIPDGSKPGDVAKLIALFQFPILEANRKALDTLVKLGAAAVPELVQSLGLWDNKTWMQAQQALIRIGTPAAAPLVAGLKEKNLYIRIHACEILPRFDATALADAGAGAALLELLQTGAPLDKAYASDAIAKIAANDPDLRTTAIGRLRSSLNSLDFDVTAAGARALGALGDKDSIPALKATLERVSNIVETARDVAWAIAALGDPAGAHYLLSKCDYQDDLVRLSVFEAFLDVTGMHGGFHPALPFEERMYALSELRNQFVQRGAAALRRPRSLELTGALRAEVLKLVREIGGNDVHADDPAESEKQLARLVEIGKPAVHIIVEGLKWPPGFAEKRHALLRALLEIKDPEAVPAVIEATLDPSMETALWAARVLEATGDAHGAFWLDRLNRRFDEVAAAGKLAGTLGHPEDMRVMLGRARAKLNDPNGGRLLMRLLFSGEPTARAGAEQALTELYGNDVEREPAVAKEARAALRSLAQNRAGVVENMREIWRKFAEAAEAAAKDATDREKIIAALNKFDFAEEACTRYHALDPRVFQMEFRRTTTGADFLANALYEDKAFRDGIAARDLHSILERRGWAQSASGLNCKFTDESITLSAAENGGGGSMTFGLGGVGGVTVPLEWWRDYEITMDVEIQKHGLWILDRYDPIWAIYHPTAVTTVAPEAPGIMHVPVEENTTYRIVHSVVGSDVIHAATPLKAGTTEPAGAGEEWRSSTALKVRKGGLVLQLEPGAKVVVKNLRLKVFRVDAAEVVNSMFATPGR